MNKHLNFAQNLDSRTSRIKQSFSSNKHFDISIILPVFNEGKNITRQIEAIEKTIRFNHEVLIIYDFDEDNTVPAAKKLAKKYATILHVKNIFGKGLIKAVRTGFEKARGDFLVVMPADLADNPNTINRMYEKIQQGFDIVCATRYAKGGRKIGGGIVKTTLSRIAGLLTPVMLGIPTTDIANGFKMYRKKVIDDIKIKSSGGWEFSVELIVKANQKGFKIGEVPTVWLDREQGKSKFKLLKWLPYYLKWYLLGIVYRLKIDRLFV